MRGERAAAFSLADHQRAGAVGGRARLEVADRVPEHRRARDLLEGDVRELQVGVGVLERVLPVLQRDADARVLGRAGAADVAADQRREVAAGARHDRHREGHRDRERPHRVALALLLEGDGEHALVDARLHEARRHDARRAADAPRGVHAQHRLVGAAEGVVQEELRHHHALEHVGGLPDHDGVDVLPGELGVCEGALGRLAYEAGHRDVLARGGVLRLTDSDDGAALGHGSTLQDADEVLLQARPGRRVGHRAARACRPGCGAPPRRCGSAPRPSSGSRRARRPTGSRSSPRRARGRARRGAPGG